MALLKKISAYALNHNPETLVLKRWMARLAPASKSQFKVLDVGCGFGRNLSWMAHEGYDATGVEVNATIVKSNVEQGLKCISLDDLGSLKGGFDVILMAHIIEHFSPSDLLGVLNRYLGLLKEGGHLLIATPLSSPYFFDDFDHVKPYHPTGLLMVYGTQQAQVQYYGNGRLELVDLWFRRSPLTIHFLKGRYVRSWSSRWIRAMDITSGLLWRAMGCRVGRVDGWVGLFRKNAVTR